MHSWLPCSLLPIVPLASVRFHPCKREITSENIQRSVAWSPARTSQTEVVGAPTFINLDQPYPDQVFTAVNWVEDRAKFGSPEQRFAGREICVSGVIQMYRGIPEIILRSPSQVEVRKVSQ